MSEYSWRGDVVQHVIGDSAFGCLRKNLNKKEIKLIACDVNRYMSQDKRCIQELKEKVDAIEK